MNDDNPRAEAASKAVCNHCKFGLLVTGKGEADFLPRLFKSLERYAGCSFRVLRKFGQLGVVGEKRVLKMVGKGTLLPGKDEEIGIEARNFLRGHPCHFVILIDDREHDRIGQIESIWNRYRTAGDTLLRPDERSRFSVHFLANMLEAYYFADSKAVNQALGKSVLARDLDGDVESIRHPKNDLKNASRQINLSFDEKEDGEKVVAQLDVEHVLSRKDGCGYLRSLFAWCVKQIQANCPVWDNTLGMKFGLPDGIIADLTKNQ